MNDRDYARTCRTVGGQRHADHAWRRGECINLIPSEQTTSSLVDRLSIAEPASRYNEHNAQGRTGRKQMTRLLQGTAFIMEKRRNCIGTAQLFRLLARRNPRD